MINSTKNNKGFTLVEMALAVLIIGLAMGMVTLGFNLREKALVIKTIKNIEAYRTATESFYNVYKQLPGDLEDANKKISGCGIFCDTSGIGTYAGDMVVGEVYWDFVTFQSYCLGGHKPKTEGTYMGYFAETMLFWYELQSAGYLKDAVTDQGVADSLALYTKADIGEAIPAIPLGGGYWIGNANGLDYYAGAGTGPNRNMFGRPSDISTYPQLGTVIISVSKRQPVDYYTNSGPIEERVSSYLVVYKTQGIEPFLPRIAAEIDRKIDDGMPATGIVQSYGYTDSCYHGTKPYYTYNEKVSTKDCGLVISIYK